MKFLFVGILSCLIAKNVCGSEIQMAQDLKVSLRDAIFDQDFEKIKGIIEENSNLNLKNQIIYQQDNPLLFALRRVGNNLSKEIFNYLTQQSDIYSKGILGQTPLFLALISQRLDFVKYFLKHYADVNINDERGNSSLHAVIFGYRDATSPDFNVAKDAIDLLKQHNAEFNHFNNYNETPLHIAVNECTSELIEYLIIKGAKVNMSNSNSQYGKVGAYNKSPLEYLLLTLKENQKIIDERCKETIKVLLKHGANTTRKILGNKTTEDLLKELGLENLLIEKTPQKMDGITALKNFAQDLAAIS